MDDVIFANNKQQPETGSAKRRRPYIQSDSTVGSSDAASDYQNCGSSLSTRSSAASNVGMHHTGVGGPNPPVAGQKKNFLVKIEGLSSLPPAKSGRACYDNPREGGISIRCPTCILV